MSFNILLVFPQVFYLKTHKPFTVMFDVQPISMPCLFILLSCLVNSILFNLVRFDLLQNAISLISFRFSHVCEASVYFYER